MSKIQNIDFDVDYSFMVQVSKKKLKELGVLDEYLQKRGSDTFDADGYDHILIYQAKLIGLIK